MLFELSSQYEVRLKFLAVSSDTTNDVELLTNVR